MSIHEDVENDYCLPNGELDKYVILYHNYDGEGYEGSSETFGFDPEGKPFYVQSSHCSCNSLEWVEKPADFKKIALEAYVGYMCSEEELKKKLQALYELMPIEDIVEVAETRLKRKIAKHVYEHDFLATDGRRIRLDNLAKEILEL